MLRKPKLKTKRTKILDTSNACAFGPLNVSITLPATREANTFLKRNSLVYKEYRGAEVRPEYDRIFRKEKKILKTISREVCLPANNTRKVERELRYTYYVVLPLLIRRLVSPLDQSLIWGVENLYYDFLLENHRNRLIPPPIRLKALPLGEHKRRAYYARINQLSTLDPSTIIVWD